MSRTRERDDGDHEEREPPPSTERSPPHPVLALQASAGNRAVAALLRQARPQPKADDEPDWGLSEAAFTLESETSELEGLAHLLDWLPSEPYLIGEGDERARARQRVASSFARPARQPPSDPDGLRSYAMYLRARRAAAQAARRQRIVPRSVRAEIERAAAVEVPDIPVATAQRPLGTVRPGSGEDYNLRAEDMRLRLEAMQLLLADKQAGNQRTEKLLARLAETYRFLEREFGAAAAAVPTKYGLYLYWRQYMLRRTEVAKLALEWFNVPPAVRDAVQLQARHVMPPEPKQEQVGIDIMNPPPPPIPEPTGGPELYMVQTLELRTSECLNGLYAAEDAIRDRRARKPVNSITHLRVTEQALKEFKQPPLSYQSAHPAVGFWMRRYRSARHEFAKAVSMAAMTPPEVIAPLQAAAKETVPREYDRPNPMDSPPDL